MTDFINWASSNDYMVMWLTYLLGVVGLLIVAWRLTRKWPRWLATSVRFLGTCLLLIPAMVDSTRELYAPALIVAPFEWLAKGPDYAAPAISALIKWSVTALLVLLVAQALGFAYRRWRAGKGNADGAEVAKSAV